MSQILSLTFANILPVISQIICASIIAFVLNNNLSKRGRVRSLKVEAFDRLVKILNGLQDATYSYVHEKPSTELKAKILSGFRDSQNEILMISEISEFDKIDLFKPDALKKMVIEYKAAVTEGSFATDNPKFSWSDWLKINESFRKIIKEITRIRIANGN